MLNRLYGILSAAFLGALILFYADQIWRSSECSGEPTRQGCYKSPKVSTPPIVLTKTADQRIADYTWWLAAFTFALAAVSCVQIAFLIRADMTARLSADSAQSLAKAAQLQAAQLEKASNSAETQLAIVGQQTDIQLKQQQLQRIQVISTHRPKLILREAIISPPIEGQPISVHFHIANIGETKGTIVRSSVRVEEFARGSRLMLHVSVETQDDLGPLVLEPGAASLIKFKGATPKWDSVRFQEKSYPSIGGPVLYRDSTIHFIGLFIYEDEIGTPRRTAFRRQLIPERQRFYRIPDEPDLDYND